MLPCGVALLWPSTGPSRLLAKGVGDSETWLRGVDGIEPERTRLLLLRGGGTGPTGPVRGVTFPEDDLLNSQTLSCVETSSKVPQKPHAYSHDHFRPTRRAPGSSAPAAAHSLACPARQAATRHASEQYAARLHLPHMRASCTAPLQCAHCFCQLPLGRTSPKRPPGSWGAPTACPAATARGSAAGELSDGRGRWPGWAGSARGEPVLHRVCGSGKGPTSAFAHQRGRALPSCAGPGAGGEQDLPGADGARGDGAPAGRLGGAAPKMFPLNRLPSMCVCVCVRARARALRAGYVQSWPATG